MNKNNIRNNYLKLRLALSDLEYKELNQELCNAFFSSVDLSGVATIHSFLPIAAKKEPDTWLIIDRLQKDSPAIRISIPKMSGETAVTNFYFEGRNQIENNRWGIPEPQFGETTPLEKIDLVIVPLLAFDQRGNRAGYGKGYYDILLKECRPDCESIGLSFFDPVDQISDINPYDVKLTGCVTPKKLYTF
jgi:5-formyltetrahydrofolate cyclo-ligase